jgi:cyclohexyl-isocyanide hydratase
MADVAFHIGMLLFPRLTQLDLTGPYEVFARMPGASVTLLWKSLEPVQSDRGLAIVPTATLETCPQLDLLCVPGGPGVNEVLTDTDVLAFLRRVASQAKYVTSVCSGSLVLGAAGLLRRRRASSHWMSREMLRSFGAEPVDARTVVDGNVITGGGVTAGIDLALQVVAEIAGRDAAEAIQLAIEYDPRPPFDAGSPNRARQDLVRKVARAAEPMLRERAEQVRRAAAALDAAKLRQ